MNQVEVAVFDLVDRLHIFELGAKEIENYMANFDLRDTRMESQLEEVKDIANDLVASDSKVLLDQMMASMIGLYTKVDELVVGLTVFSKSYGR